MVRASVSLSEANILTLRRSNMMHIYKLMALLALFVSLLSFFLSSIALFFKHCNDIDQQDISFFVSSSSYWYCYIDIGSWTGRDRCSYRSLALSSSPFDYAEQRGILSCVLLIQSVGLHLTSLICSFYCSRWRTSRSLLCNSSIVGPEMDICILDPESKRKTSLHGTYYNSTESIFPVKPNIKSWNSS